MRVKPEIKTSSASGVEAAVKQNIATVHDFRKQADEQRRFDEKVIDDVAFFFGGPKSLYLHFVVYAVLISLHFFDEASRWTWTPTVNTLGLIASLEALFLALFVLINQRRTSQVERRNTDLHLQMSLLAEQEVKRNGDMLALIAKQVGISDAEFAVLNRVKSDVHPSEMMSHIEKHERENPTDSIKPLTRS